MIIAKFLNIGIVIVNLPKKISSISNTRCLFQLDKKQAHCKHNGTYSIWKKCVQIPCQIVCPS